MHKQKQDLTLCFLDISNMYTFKTLKYTREMKIC